jgi:hypothetical protein
MLSIVLVRGLPGSNRYTTGEVFADGNPNYAHFGVDALVEETGKWDAAKAATASNLCKKLTRAMLRRGMDVVVSDTFALISEMQPYFDMVDEFGADLMIIEATGPSPHYQAPEELVAELRAKWETIDTPNN